MFNKNISVKTGCKINNNEYRFFLKNFSMNLRFFEIKFYYLALLQPQKCNYWTIVSIEIVIWPSRSIQRILVHLKWSLLNLSCIKWLFNRSRNHFKNRNRNLRSSDQWSVTNDLSDFKVFKSCIIIITLDCILINDHKIFHTSARRI